MKGYPGVSAFEVRYITRGKCKSIDKETRKWLERKSAGGKHVVYTYYKARITHNGRGYFLGHFENPTDAAMAYLAAKERLRHGKKVKT